MFFVRVCTITVACILALSCAKDPEIAKREHADNGDRYVADGKFREAIIEYRQAVSLDGRFGEARLKLADAYLQVNDPQRALREYVRAADLLDDTEAHLKAGKLLLLSGNFEDAKTRADKALARSPGNVDAHVLKGTALAGLRDLDAAVEEIETAIKEDPTRATSYSTLAAVQQAQGQTALAESSFLQGVKSDPGSATAALALANFYWRAGRTEEADRSLSNALKLAPDDPFTNRFAAAFYVATGRVSDAEGPLKKLAENSSDVEGRLRLADYYLATKRTEEAKELLKRAAAEPEGFAGARLRLANLARLEGDPATAERLLDETLKKEPRNVDALIRRAEFRLAENKRDEAMTSARLAVAADGSAARAHYILGRVLANVSEFEEAEAAYQEALRLNPRLVEATMELAKVKLALGKADQAVQLAETTLTAVPGNPDAQLVLVRGHLRLGRVDAAEKVLRSLTTAFPEAPAVHVEMGRLLAMQGDFGRARQAFDRALARDPADLGAVQGLTALDTREKQHVTARVRIDNAIAIRPDSGGLRLLSGRLYHAVQDTAAAEQAFKQAVAIDPNNMGAFVALASFYAQQNRLPEATRELETIVARRPTDVGARTSLGMLLELQNKSDEAEQHYEEALAVSPRAAVAANNLAWMYAERGEKLDVALQLARIAKAELPDVPEVSDTVGWVYYKNNLPGLAIDPFKQAIEQDANNASYHLHLGLAYAKTGEPDKARASIGRALSLNPNVAGADEARAALAAIGSR